MQTPDDIRDVFRDRKVLEALTQALLADLRGQPIENPAQVAQKQDEQSALEFLTGKDIKRWANLAQMQGVVEQSQVVKQEKADAVVEAGMEFCVCPQCGKRIKSRGGKRCIEIKCPDCGRRTVRP